MGGTWVIQIKFRVHLQTPIGPAPTTGQAQWLPLSVVLSGLLFLSDQPPKAFIIKVVPAKWL